jgi:hypothetical protein
MRGQFPDQGGMFSCIHPAKRITANHPLRRIRELVREDLYSAPKSNFRRGQSTAQCCVILLLFPYLAGIKNSRGLFHHRAAARRQCQ